MRSAFFISVLFITTYAFSQDCNCSSQLSFVINYYEQNNPAFQKLRADPASYQSYLTRLQKLKAEAKLNKDDDHCILYLDRYVGLLKDHHSGIGFNLTRKDLSTPELIAGFKQSKEYLQFKKIAVDTAQLIPVLVAKKPSDIEGIYTNGATISFGIIKKENTPGKYIGVVLKSNKLLDVGHVLLELSEKPGNSYDVTYNLGLLGFNFQRVFKNLVIQNGQITAFGFYKKMNTSLSSKDYEFKALNQSVNYLRLHSFDESITDELDSFYTTIDKEIKSKPYFNY